MNSVSFLLPLLMTVSSTAPAKERDYLGWPFDSRTFPLCRQYGCHVSRQPPTQALDRGTVHFTLRKTPAKLNLYLAPDQSVMGLSIIIPHKANLAPDLSLVQRTVNNAAQQTFDPTMLPRCIAQARQHLPASGNAEKRGIILTNNHYGVQCIVKRFNAVLYAGALVFFDL